MKMVVKPNRESATESVDPDHAGEHVYDMMDFCDTEGRVWMRTYIDLFFGRGDANWQRDVYDRLRYGHEVTLELTIAKE